MNLRYYSGKVLTKQRVFETFISPGYYIALTAGLLIGYFIVSGFLNTIDSSGFNPALNPFYGLIVRSIAGTFGNIFVIKLFSEGPFIFALHMSFAPVVIFLVVNTISKFGFEKNAGALQLISYGPADVTSSFTGFFIKDLFYSIVSLSIYIVYFLLLSKVYNLLLGPGFYFSVIVLLFLSAAIFAYGIFFTIITGSSGSGLPLFIAVFFFFGLIQIGTYTIINKYVQTLASVFSWVTKWISPIFYWAIGLVSIDYSPGLFFICLLCLSVLSLILLFLSHFMMQKRGVIK